MQRPYDRVLEKLNRLRATWNVQTTAFAVLLGLAILALVATQSNDSSTSHTDLFADRNLTPTELERIEAALGEAMLSDYEFENGRIQVPAEKRGPYLSAIRDAKALPQSFHSPTEEAIRSATLIETSRQRSQRLHYALEKEARLAICALPDVVDAFVHIDVVADQTFRRQTKAAAVVGVKTQPGQPLDERSFRTILAMLLNFKAGLSPEAVTITDLTTGNCFRGSMDSQSPEALATLRRADLERSWKKKLASAIAFARDASLTVRVVPSKDARQAQFVSCSVSVPRDVQAGESSATKNQHEMNIRHRVQSALLPLIPHQNENVNDLIAVTVFDRLGAPDATPHAWRRIVASPNLLAATLVGVAGIMALLLLKNPSRPKPRLDDLSPSLKIFEGQESPRSVELGVTPSDQLQTIVAEDPDSVAESLSDFIDRAS